MSTLRSNGVDLGDLLTMWRPAGRRGSGWRPFLHHISKGQPQPQRRSRYRCRASCRGCSAPTRGRWSRRAVQRSGAGAVTAARPGAACAADVAPTADAARGLRPLTAPPTWDSEYDQDVWAPRAGHRQSQPCSDPVRLDPTAVAQGTGQAVGAVAPCGRFGPETAASGTRAITRFGEYLALKEPGITGLDQL